MLSVAIIGTGQIAGGYDQAKLEQNTQGVFTHAGAYRKSGKYFLETVCDLDGQRASAFQAYWGFSKRVNRIEEVCGTFHDVISICTPDETHYPIIKALIEAQCCKCIFIEKPIAQTLGQIQEITELAASKNIAIVVNFQRRFDTVLAGVREKIIARSSYPLAVTGYYIKGLDHIGTTMLDTITYMLGYPRAVFGYNKIFNQQVQGDTYEFILFYEDFNVTVKTVDSARYEYSYHIFELDLLMRDERVCINDNSRQVEVRRLADYVYSGVRVLDDHHLVQVETEYDVSMLHSVSYIHNVVTDCGRHTINTPEIAYNVKLIIEKIKQSYEFQQTIDIKVSEWKK